MANQADYPHALWMPAAAGNYRTSGSRAITTIVIHITDGRATEATQTARWFANPSQHNPEGQNIHVSAHYVVGRRGEVVQCVSHQDIAIHAGHANATSIGIEHVVPSGSRPTSVQYEASGQLVRWLCNTLSIPMDRVHIKGHAEADLNTTHRSCPNKAWDWAYYWICLGIADGPSFESVITGMII